MEKTTRHRLSQILISWKKESNTPAIASPPDLHPFLSPLIIVTEGVLIRPVGPRNIGSGTRFFQCTDPQIDRSS